MSRILIQAALPEGCTPAEIKSALAGLFADKETPVTVWHETEFVSDVAEVEGYAREALEHVLSNAARRSA